MAISSNVLRNIVAGVREKEGNDGEIPYLIPTISSEVIITLDTTVWTHHSFFISEWLLVGTCHCVFKGKVMMKARTGVSMASRSNNGIILYANISLVVYSTRPGLIPPLTTTTKN